MRRFLVAAAALVTVLVGQPGARSAPADACGLPDARPIWIDYGEGSVPPDVRAVFARPGVVVTASGTALPRDYRAKGAATTYFVLSLPSLVGDPTTPADAAAMTAVADALYDRAVASTACSTPWIALNELFAAQAPTPWTPGNAQYRADVLALVQRLAARGAHPALLVHGNPNVDGDAANWWRAIAQAGDIVYEAYYVAPNISRLGPILGPRRVRLGMRSIVALFTGIGIQPARLGFMLGFQVAPGAAGREGLQPREEWFRFVKWNALAARQVASDTGTGSIWSWGWGTFGPASTDPDKPAAACVYLWTRDPALCDGPAAAGPAFNTALTEGPIVLPGGIHCSFDGGVVNEGAVKGITDLTRDPRLAVTAAFARAVLRARVPVSQAQVLRVERAMIARAFRGSQKAYLRALGRKHATRAVARGVIADELRRRAIAASAGGRAPGQTTLLWAADQEAAAANSALCVRDDLPGRGNFPASMDLEVGVVPLPAYLPFLFADKRPPAPPQALVATPGTKTVTLDWADSTEADLVGYIVFRAATPGGPYVRLTPTPLTRSTYTDGLAPTGVPAYYVVRAVDTSRNRSDASAEVWATPAS